MFLRLNWLSGGICGRLEAYIGYKGDIKSKVEQLELFRRNLGRRHIMELEENEKAGIECRNRSNINFSSQTFPGLVGLTQLRLK